MGANQSSPSFLVPQSTRRFVGLAAIGAVLFLAIMLLFLQGVREVPDSWGKHWKLRPLLIAPLFGSASGVGVAYLVQWQKRFGWNRILVWLALIAGVTAGFFVGFILGLDGTLWD